MAKKHKKTVSVTKPELDDIFVSAVVPADSQAEAVVAYVTELTTVLTNSYTNFETIIVDNGLEAEQVQAIVAILNKVPCVRLMRLSRNHTRDAAVFSGLEAAIGDFVCVLSPTLDPPLVVRDMIATNRAGIDIVQGVSAIPIDGRLISKLGRTAFYWYNRRFLKTDIPLNATYLVSFNRQAVNALTRVNRRHRYVRHLAQHIGFKLDTFIYTPLQNPRNDNKLRTGFLEALEIVTSYSSHPLRFVTWMGILAGSANLLYAGYVLGINLVKQNVAEGWTTLSLQSSVMFFFIFAILIVLAEYIGRILTESRQEPQYHIMEEFVSTVAIANENRRNITK